MAPKKKTPAKKAVVKQEKKVVKIPVVIFNGKLDPSEPNDVFISINGRSMVAKRGIQVPVPQPFLDVIDNASYNTYNYNEKGDRQFSGKIVRYPYQKVGECTLAEFRKAMQNGKVTTQKSVLG